MKSHRFAPLIVFAALFSTSSLATDSKLLEIANSFSTKADACLVDVRDKAISYARSANCAGLGALSLQYLKAGGELSYKSKSVPLYAFVMIEGSATAWSALAVSNAKFPKEAGYSLW